MLVQAAETRFQRGLQALQDGRTLEALALFEASLELERRLGARAPQARYLSFYGLCLAQEEARRRDGAEFCRQAIALDRVFAGLVAQGVGIWMGFQAFINMGVNLGALPTKGLTLPLMSYGGSAVLMNVVAIAVVLRIDYENRVLMRGGRP